MLSDPSSSGASHSLAELSTANDSARVYTLRGLACLMVVAFHAIGAEPTTGMHVTDNSIYRGFCNLLMHVRMPLFAFLSGLVYALRPVEPGQLRIFAHKKFRRLVIPFITVTTIYYLLTWVVPYDKSTPPAAEFWRIYLFPFAQYWFLQAIVLIFALVAVLEQCRMIAKPSQFWLVYLLAALASVFLRVEPNLFSADHALELLPFFLLGLGVTRFRDWLVDRRTGLVCTMAFLGLTIWYGTVIFGAGGPIIPKRTLPSFIMGTFGLLALLHSFPAVVWLAAIGRYSFAVYLFHSFFTAGTRQIAMLSDVAVADLVLFVLCVTAGVLGPIALERAARRVPWISRILLGQAGRSGSPAHAAS
jgi:glucans biosynthesis protein C